MAYVSDSNLTQFWGLAKGYIKAEDSRYANWQKTEKAGAVTCWPVGGTELKPNVEFLFSETGPASGEKGLGNPSTITGVSTITVTRCETVGVDSTDYPLPLNGTYYGGTVDLASGLMTVTWWGHVFDGTETPVAFTALTNNGRCIFFQPELQAKNAQNQGCTHLPLLVNFGDDSAHFFVNASGSNTGLIMFAPYLTKASFMSWLADEYVAGTPVTVACELKTPYTVQLDAIQIISLTQTDKYTPRVNTVYSDQQAVQVGYVKSPIRSEYELTQAIIATEGGE